ncbi:hypothetical protein [Lacihabitans soyangensis]|uniref:Uncharacterized protein n=1 Tax=Lacihabitans soyangensis TaxID=869394 RepID=A0AAE3H1F6_9BACT|nr:hypothetical protein [Lacihabitans soyangensis]MCP9762296.1 hypothetical protein [Lacihabitans soyangensis]
MELKTKEIKFKSLFRQKSFTDYYDLSGILGNLLIDLSEEEIDFLVNKNVVFIRTCNPASTINIKNIEINGELNLINFDHYMFKKLMPEEFLAVLLHEIGHIKNPELKGMEAEYAADKLAAEKGYKKWIISSLKKGIQNEWMGFEKDSCKLRIEKLNESDYPKYSEAKYRDDYDDKDDDDDDDDTKDIVQTIIK